MVIRNVGHSDLHKVSIIKELYPLLNVERPSRFELILLPLLLGHDLADSIGDLVIIGAHILDGQVTGRRQLQVVLLGEILGRVADLNRHQVRVSILHAESERERSLGAGSQ